MVIALVIELLPRVLVARRDAIVISLSHKAKWRMTLQKNAARKEINKDW